ncbi:unnamed protein product [Lepeophtheirus salmonis]|uniref:(salmon louse) hypothetical protein n=2 Tax=Lepeophtheirus salmonis TaxID=72036 RepID=A0A7R8D767_LEPSM|nr:unnamed protein product [Lepeophtheirus salmonis]CAF3045862.1 unnamed protein product [Lepeophtheirus salmonis]
MVGRSELLLLKKKKGKDVRTTTHDSQRRLMHTRCKSEPPNKQKEKGTSCYTIIYNFQKPDKVERASSSRSAERLEKMNKTPLLSLERRRSPRKKLKTSTPTLEEEESPYPEEIYQSQVPQEDGIYWAYDNPKLDEELHRKARIRSTPKLRLKIAGSRRRNNNNDDEEAKEFLNQCFGDFIKKNKENSDAISDSIVQINETKDQGSSNLFDDNEDEDEFLLLASQAIDSSVIKKTPLSLKKDFNRKKSTDHFEDDSFDILLSQLPEDVFNKSTPKSTKLTLKRHDEIIVLPSLRVLQKPFLALKKKL